MKKNKGKDKYPRIIVDSKKLLSNYKKMIEATQEKGLFFFAVTKGFCAYPDLVQVIYDAGVKYMADSRLENFDKNQQIPFEHKLLLRLPMQSEAERVVNTVDMSLNSEISTIRALNEAALAAGKKHGVLLMVDLGDLREGMTPDEAVEMAGDVLKMEGITLEGIAVNLTCYGGVIPSEKNLGVLNETAEKIEKKYGIELPIVSGGNSSSMKMMYDGKIPPKINSLRLGEAVLRGREAAYLQPVPDMFDDCFVIQAEIIEMKEKDSVPTGEIGFDAFANVPSFVDKGRQIRGLLALGKQDVDLDGLRCEGGIEIIGGSGDHTIINLTHADKQYKVGDIISFKCDYSAILRAFTSAYVEKIVK